MNAPARSSASPQNPLTGNELSLIDAWWRACNYLSVGMIYLKDNPLLREPLKHMSRTELPFSLMILRRRSTAFGREAKSCHNCGSSLRETGP